MTDQKTENGQAPLAGWAIAQVHGMTLIGKLTQTGLSPVYELRPSMGQDPRSGSLQIAHPAMPVWLLGLKEIELPSGCLLEPVERFSLAQRKSLLESVKFADGLQSKLKLQESAAGQPSRIIGV